MTTALALAVVVGGGVASPAYAAQSAEPSVALVVGLTDGASQDAPTEALSDEPGIKVVDTEVVGAGEAVVVDVPASDAAAAEATLRADPAVAYVEPDHVATMSAAANDPYLPYQWGLNNTNVPGAWRLSTGSSAVTVAVLDTGVSNVSELSGRVLPGKDFVNNDNAATDDEGHGTAVASVVAAKGNNAYGIAGLCWTCKILPVKVLDGNGNGGYSDIVNGVYWAVANGADIINMSLGGSSSSQMMFDAVAFARSRNVLVIAAAGNEGSSAHSYPAAIPAVLAVGGSTSANGRYSWSNYGNWIDVAAPGCNLAQSNDGKIKNFCGTSSASPFAAGIAALTMARNPNATAAQVSYSMALNSANLSWTQYGLLNAGKTVALSTSRATPDRRAPYLRTTKAPRNKAKVKGTVTIKAAASDASGISRVQLIVNGKVVATDRTAGYSFKLKAKRYGKKFTVRMRAYDKAGNSTTTASRKLRR